METVEHIAENAEREASEKVVEIEYNSTKKYNPTNGLYQVSRSTHPTLTAGQKFGGLSLETNVRLAISQGYSVIIKPAGE